MGWNDLISEETVTQHQGKNDFKESEIAMAEFIATLEDSEVEKELVENRASTMRMNCRSPRIQSGENTDKLLRLPLHSVNIMVVVCAPSQQGLEPTKGFVVCLCRVLGSVRMGVRLYE